MDALACTSVENCKFVCRLLVTDANTETIERKSNSAKCRWCSWENARSRLLGGYPSSLWYSHALDPLQAEEHQEPGPLPPFEPGRLPSSPKKAHEHQEMGPQNWTFDPTPKTPLDPPPRNSLCTVFCWENQHLHKEFGRLSPLLDPPARVPPKFFMQIFFGCFFRS